VCRLSYALVPAFRTHERSRPLAELNPGSSISPDLHSICTKGVLQLQNGFIELFQPNYLRLRPSKFAHAFLELSLESEQACVTLDTLIDKNDREGFDGLVRRDGVDGNGLSYSNLCTVAL